MTRLLKYATPLHLTHQHDDNVGVSVVPQLSQPSLHILVGEVLGWNGYKITPILTGGGW